MVFLDHHIMKCNSYFNLNNIINKKLKKQHCQHFSRIFYILTLRSKSKVTKILNFITYIDSLFEYVDLSADC